MQKSIIRSKLLQVQPDIYFGPELVDLKVLEFYRAGELFKLGIKTKEHIKRQISLVIVALER